MGGVKPARETDEDEEAEAVPYYIGLPAVKALRYHILDGQN
jgi:hypothetical protein